MDRNDTIVRYRIKDVAVKHFAQRTLSKVHLAEIARDLNVDRSVVKLYFSSTDELLSIVIDSFVKDIEAILLTFVDGVMVAAINSGSMQIKTDRLHFTDSRSAAEFCDKLIDYLEAIFDYLILHSKEYAVIVQESRASGIHHGCLAKVTNLFLPVDVNPLFQRLKVAAKIRAIPGERAYFLQTNILPILYSAQYKEEFGQLLPDYEILKRRVLSEIQARNAQHHIGQDIMFTIK